mgnify:CR=1 FL=1
MDQLTRMRAFLAVVDAGGFSAAARELGRSKALLSKYVGDLEDALGVRLLNRTTRRIGVTDTGRAYYEACGDILARLDELDASVQESVSAARGRLRVSGPVSLGERFLTDMILDFMQSYPQIEVELQLEDRFVDLVEEGVDIAIRVANLSDSSLIARKLCDSNSPLCATPDYLQRHGVPDVPDDLTRHICIIDTNRASPRTWFFERNGQRTFVPVSGPFTVNSAAAARAACLRGMGIASMPAFIVEPDIARGDLVSLLAEWCPPTAAIYAVYPHRRHLSRRVRLLVDHLADAFKGGAPWCGKIRSKQRSAG